MRAGRKSSPGAARVEREFGAQEHVFNRAPGLSRGGRVRLRSYADRMDTQPVPYMERSRLYYEAQGFTKAYEWAHFDEVPFARPAKPLGQSTLALITTAALYDREASDPRHVASAPLVPPPDRLWANDLSWDRQATHMEDRGSYFPVEALLAARDDGRIGALSETFHCVPTDYSKRRTLEVDAPDVLARCRADGADVALLVPI